MREFLELCWVLALFLVAIAAIVLIAFVAPFVVGALALIGVVWKLWQCLALVGAKMKDGA